MIVKNGYYVRRRLHELDNNVFDSLKKQNKVHYCMYEYNNYFFIIINHNERQMNVTNELKNSIQHQRDTERARPF